MSRLYRLAVAALTLGLPATASAHGTIAGFGGFYAGVLHPLSVPAHLITLVSLGLLISQRPPGQIRFCLPGFVLALVLGLCLTLSLGTFAFETSILGVALVTGLVLAIIPVAPQWLAVGLCVAGGLLIGLDSSPDQSLLRDNLLVAGGILVGCVILPSYLVIITKAIKVDWKLIALRVLGSWIAAATAMVVALHLV